MWAPFQVIVKRESPVRKVEYVAHAFPVTSFLQKTEFDTESNKHETESP